MYSCVDVREEKQPYDIEYLFSDDDEFEIEFDDEDGEPSLDRNFYFIFDGSGSMDEYCANNSKIKGAQEATRKFLEKVPEDANLGLVIFDNTDDYDDTFHEAVPLGSNNRDAFNIAIDNIIPGGATPLGESIIYGIDQLVEQYKKQLGYGEFRLIVVTDGLENGQITIFDASLYADKYRVPIYAIGLCIDFDHPLRKYSLSYREANNYEDLEKALEETIAESVVFDLTELYSG